jgi:uncharacterized protein YggU (UPF0235/DUF167 family)
LPEVGIATVKVKVVPASSRNRVAGWLGGALKVTVTVPAEGGKANAAVTATLAEALGLPASAVRILRGSTSPRKLVEIDGLSESEIDARLAERSA